MSWLVYSDASTEGGSLITGVIRVTWLDFCRFDGGAKCLKVAEIYSNTSKDVSGMGQKKRTTP